MTSDNPRELFLRLVAAEKPSPVLEAGSRQNVAGISRLRHSWFPYLPRQDYVGTDLFAGVDVDEVSDIHALPEKWYAHFGAFLAASVFEHLDRPWIAAQQIGKVLRPGGLCYIATHQCFPVHDFPNDFFRFSDRALALLFEDAGFDILAVGYEHRCTITPPPEILEPGLVTMWNTNHPSYIHVHLTARRQTAP